MPDRPVEPKEPVGALAVELIHLLRELRSLFPSADGRVLQGALIALVEHGEAAGLLSDHRRKLSPDELREVLLAGLERGQTGDWERTPEDPAQVPGRGHYHPCIHLARDGSFYSFFQARGGPLRACELVSVDSRGQVRPTGALGGGFPLEVRGIEQRAAAVPWLGDGVPEALLNEQGRSEAIAQLREGFVEGLPFAGEADERRLRVWSLLTYLYPLLEVTPLLRVRVPDIRSARHVQGLLEQCCFNALAVHRGDLLGEVRRHQRDMAGTVIFAAELATGRLPRFARRYLEDMPRPGRYEPPVAFIETLGQSVQVPGDWVVDVELSAYVPRVRLAKGWRTFGCALALGQGGARVEAMLAHAGGVPQWLQLLLFDDLLEPGEGESGDAEERAKGQLARQVEAVWADCLQESGDGEASKARQCNVGCLRERLGQRFAGMRGQLEEPGWGSRGFKRRLMEAGVVAFDLRNMTGCLSRAVSGQWKGAGRNGVRVPDWRLPAGG